MKNKEKSYPIILNHLTAREYTTHKDTFEEYKQTVIMMLRVKDLFEFENEIIEKRKDDPLLKERPITMQSLLLDFPDKYVGAGMRRRNKEDEFTQTWFDLWVDLTVTPEFPNYDILFCYQLRNTKLLEVDDFLNFTLKEYYHNDISVFSRFVKISIRQYGQKLLSSDTIETLNEWITEKEKQVPLEGITEASEKSKTKGIVKRESADNLTKLNQEQTALLIKYMQLGKLILKDEYLSNKQAGQAFNILTGYSADTLRQNVGKTELERITNKKNLTDLSNALTALKLLVDNDLKPKK